MSRPHPQAARRALRAMTGAGLSLALALALSACSGDDEQPAPEPPPATSTAPEPTAAPKPTKVVLGELVGRLPKPERKRVRTQVPGIVEAWWDAAFLGGSYPRESFAGSFADFTPRAAARARKDDNLLTNRRIGARIDSVTPLKRRIAVDVLSPDKRARAATARFTLRFRTTGDKAGVTVVRGRLFLTRTKGKWQVFGYDVSKGTPS